MVEGELQEIIQISVAYILQIIQILHIFKGVVESGLAGVKIAVI